MDDKTLYNLVNPEFDFGFNNKIYHLRKATLDKAVQYQKKVKELAGDGNIDSVSNASILAFCVYIMLKDQEPTITEEFVMNLIPGDVDGLELLCTLGFIHPSKLAAVKEVQASVMKKLTSDSSSQS